MPSEPPPQPQSLPALEEVLEAFPHGALLLDPENRITAANNWILRNSGLPPEKVIGHNIFSVFAIPRKGALGIQWAREQNRPQILSQKLHGYFIPVAFPEDHISGFGYMQQEATITPLLHRPGFLLILVRDVTPAVIGEWRLKALQTELDQALAAAEWANRAKSEFLTMASHDLRTPMNGVLGFAGLLSETHLDEEQREYVQAILSSGKMMVTLLNDILDFSRIEAGQLEILPSRFQLKPAIERMLRLPVQAAEQKDLAFSLTFADNLPEFIECDETRLQQILVNLVSNAIKFTEQGGVEVHVGGAPAQEASTSHEWMLEIAVKDSGIGIAPEDLPSLFQPFKQVGDRSKRAAGTGLGLSICKRLCELLQGGLDVVSEPGVGSTFTFRIPVTICPSPADLPEEPPPTPAQSPQPSQNLTQHLPTPAPQNPATPPAPKDLPPCSLRGLRALLVDDVSMNRKLGAVLLRKLGLETDTASSGPEALELLRSHSYHIIFLDLKMPGMDGIETARRIRAGEAGPAAASSFLCALTALAGADHRAQCQSVGMNAFLTKPLRREELLTVLTQLPQLKQSPE